MQGTTNHLQGQALRILATPSTNHVESYTNLYHPFLPHQVQDFNHWLTLEVQFREVLFGLCVVAFSVMSGHD
jgi:hypothetical protein